MRGAGEVPIRMQCDRQLPRSLVLNLEMRSSTKACSVHRGCDSRGCMDVAWRHSTCSDTQMLRVVASPSSDPPSLEGYNSSRRALELSAHPAPLSKEIFARRLQQTARISATHPSLRPTSTFLPTMRRSLCAIAMAARRQRWSICPPGIYYFPSMCRRLSMHKRTMLSDTQTSPCRQRCRQRIFPSERFARVAPTIDMVPKATTRASNSLNTVPERPIPLVIGQTPRIWMPKTSLRQEMRGSAGSRT
ncbi:hypothetical protein C8T65DRAFT_76919 [Cerioporus squamosus]|nr:hypothetical protein C8T65DRAFT_76919 [Cerioporus squamosus]